MRQDGVASAPARAKSIRHKRLSLFFGEAGASSKTGLQGTFSSNSGTFKNSSGTRSKLDRVLKLWAAKRSTSTQDRLAV